MSHLLLLVWLAACGGAPAPAEAPQPSVEKTKVKAGKAKAGKARAANLAVPTLTVSASGLAGVTAETPFTEAGLAAALPGSKLTPVERSEEGNAFTVYLVSARQRTTAEIWPDPSGEKVGHIYIMSPLIAGPDGVKVGDALSQHPDLPRFTCRPGAESFALHALCQVPGVPLLYVYKPGNWGLDPNTVPDLATIGAAPLVRMTWNPLLK